MDISKTVRTAFSFIVIVFASVVLFFAAKWLFPCLLPFLFAYLTSSIAEKPIEYLSKKYRLKRSFSSTLCLSVLLIIISSLITLLVIAVYYELSSFGDRLPELVSKYAQGAERIEQSISLLISDAPPDYRDILLKIFQALTEKLASVPSYLSGKLPNILSAIAGATPKIFLFIVTYIIATFSIGSDRNRLKASIASLLPEKAQPFISSVKGELGIAASGFFKSQLLLMMITFFELCVCFYLIRIGHPPLAAGVIALLDALPLLGTGTVLVPWAVISLIGGDKMQCLYLIVIYLLTALSRRLLEPKVVSSTLGLDPLISLLSIYGGFVLFGVGGMMLLPLFVLLSTRLFEAYKKISR